MGLTTVQRDCAACDQHSRLITNYNVRKYSLIHQKWGRSFDFCRSWMFFVLNK